MATFKGLLNHSGADYHSFFVKDEAFEDIGLSYFTQNSLKEYIESNKKELEAYFGNPDQAIDSLTGASSFAEEPSIILFDLNNNSYSLSSNDFLLGKTLTEVIDGNDQIQSGQLEDETISDIVASVQNSLSGCITFRPTVSIFGSERTPIVHLFLKNKEDNKNERVITVKGAPVITDIPRLPTGRKYGWQETQDVMSSGIGIIAKPAQDDNSNPLNDITGPLRVSYNRALGCWESGSQQILAKLLTDIDAAKLVNSVNYDGIDSISNDEIFNVESTNYMGQFKTGIALPMTVHGGNPHTFGPNTIKETEKKERIRVVNRAPRSFKKGDTVMCSLIDSEWIIQGFDIAETKLNTSIKVGKWSFNKFLVNSDSFFRDKRFDNDNNRYITLYTPDKYETISRTRYYRHMYPFGNVPQLSDPYKTFLTTESMNDLGKIAQLNLYTPSEKPDKPKYTFDETDEVEALRASTPSETSYDFETSDGYVQSSAFDQVGNHMGGTSSTNFLGRTNVAYETNGEPDASDGFIYVDNLPIFWGPLFPDGFGSQQTQALKKVRPMKASVEGVFVKSNDGSKILSKDDAENGLSRYKMFDSAETEANLLQLPAEIGINGSLSGLSSSPIEWVSSFKNVGSVNMMDACRDFLLSNQRYHWLYKVQDSGNVYGLSPTQPSKIQFSPLQVEFTTHDYTPTTASKEWDELKNAFKSYLREGVTGPAWGNMTNRESSFPKIGPDTKYNASGPIGFPLDVLPAADTSGFDYKSNFVGIIAAKNKFSAFGSIVLTVDQYFGLPAKSTVSGGQTGGVTILPIGGGIGWVGPSTPSRVNSSPQWGSSDDKYNSFGTTALHVRIFDQWPDDQTIYDGRYFSVLHFNPIVSSGDPNTILTKTLNAGERIPNWEKPENVSVLNNYKYERQVDVQQTPVDFRVPTFGHPSDTSIDNKVIPLDAVVNRFGCNNKALRPVNEWRINPIRRGQLLTMGGFRYYKRSIGLSDNKVVVKAGKGFVANEELELAKGVKIKITGIASGGGITSFTFTNRGEGFMPSDFATVQKVDNQNQYGYLLSIPNSGEGGESASILILNGIIWDKLATDAGPLERTSGPIRVTSSSQRGGVGAIEAGLVTNINLGTENTTGKYDAFYFFHNDILHTVGQGIDAFVPGFAQYVTLTISAG
jgi:hypothetical protein